MGRGAEKGFGFVALNITGTSEVSVSGYSGDQQLAKLTAVEMIDRQIRHNLVGPRENPVEHLVRQPWIEGETLKRRSRIEG